VWLLLWGVVAFFAIVANSFATLVRGVRPRGLHGFFRPLLTIPHLVWLYLWGIAALVVLVVNWFATLLRGRSPDALHRFLGAYVRYHTDVTAYLMLVANPFPSFLGRPGTYPVDLHVEPRERQSRWTVCFRLPLALPAMIVAAAYGGLLVVAAFLGWFSALVRGAMPVGLRNAMAPRAALPAAAQRLALSADTQLPGRRADRRGARGARGGEPVSLPVARRRVLFVVVDPVLVIVRRDRGLARRRAGATDGRDVHGVDVDPIVEASERDERAVCRRDAIDHVLELSLDVDPSPVDQVDRHGHLASKR